jgi:WD40 repeat protein
MQNGHIRVVDLREGKELWTAVASLSWITSMAFSPDGKTLATAAGFGESDVRLWDVATGKEIGRLEGHANWVGAIVFWPDGKRLATSSGDQTIRTWDLATRTCTDVMRGHRLEVWRLALLPDNRTLVSGCKDGVVCLWDTSATHPRREQIEWSERFRNWCFGSDSRSVVTINPDGQVAQWSGRDFQEKQVLLETGVKVAKLWSVCFSRDGRWLACGSEDGNLSVWDVTRRSMVRAFKPATGALFPRAFLAQGNRLIFDSDADDRWFEWDLGANREIQSWAAPVGFPTSGLSPDEQVVVTFGPEGDAQVRNLAQQSSARQRLGLQNVEGMAFAPSGTLLAVTSILGYARVWEPGSWREVATLKGFLNAVDDVTFSPDGTRLATAAARDAEALKLWSVDGWQDVMTLRANGHRFGSVHFSPDGNSIGVMTEDLGILHIWQAPPWEETAAVEANQKANDRQP